MESAVLFFDHAFSILVFVQWLAGGEELETLRVDALVDFQVDGSVVVCWGEKLARFDFWIVVRC